MRSTLALEVGDAESLARVGADVAVAGFFRDQRPLRGGAGLADWRLCGFLSRLLVAARAQGDLGEAVLTTTHGRFRAPKLLLVGLGPRQRYGADAHRAAVQAAVDRLLDLGAGSAAVDLPPPAGDAAVEAVAEGIVEGACAALDPRAVRFLLRVVAVGGTAGRMRTALDHAASAHPRGATSVRLVRPPTAGPGTSNGSQPRA
jgi:Cytosol aminopeptidase family, N-terminal domain